jgi:S1-C subfamily serine protease
VVVFSVFLNKVIDMKYSIAFLLSLVFISCSSSQDEIQSQIDIAVDKAVKQKESDTQLLEEKIVNLEQKIDELNKIYTDNNKSQFFTWGTEYFKSIVDIGYIDTDDNLVELGTGAIISTDGYVITNYHVATGQNEFALFNYSEFDPEKNEWINPETNQAAEMLTTDWIAGSMCYDLALLKINSEKEFLKLDWYGDFEPGLEVFTLGYPSVGQGEITVSNGVVSSLRYFGDTFWTAPGFDTFGHTAPIFFGNSGSPVLSQDGKIVGINYTAYKEEDEQFSISYAIENQIVQQIVDDYLIKGNDYLSIGADGEAENLYYYLPEGDERNLPFYSIISVHPDSIAEIAKIERNELLFFFGDYYVSQNDFSDYGIDGYPLVSDLCDLIRDWEEGSDQSIELTLYSCDLEEFYVATLSKLGEPYEPYLVDNPFEDFTKNDINLACKNGT